MDVLVRQPEVSQPVELAPTFTVVELRRCLRGGDAAAITELFNALSHFALSNALTRPDLLKAALEYDFSTLSPDLLSAYHHFVLNLVSANAAFVEHSFHAFARRAFLSDDPLVLATVHTCIRSVLGMYSAATTVLSTVVCQRYPHQVRKTAELAAFTRSVLSIARECVCPQLCADIIAAVVEKLVAVQALVSADDSASDKMDSLLAEVFAFIDQCCEENCKTSFKLRVVDPLIVAFERFVIPAQGGKYVPFVLLRCLSHAGTETAQGVCERFRQNFFSYEIREEARLSYLSMSAIITGHSPVVSPTYVLLWMRSVAHWCNKFVDNKGVHHRLVHVFCIVVGILVKLTTVRKDALDPMRTNSKDALSSMRLFRVLVSAHQPWRYVPIDVRKVFSTLVSSFGVALPLEIESEMCAMKKWQTVVLDLQVPTEMPLTVKMLDGKRHFVGNRS